MRERDFTQEEQEVLERVITTKKGDHHVVSGLRGCVIAWRGKSVRTVNVIYEILVGQPIPDGMALYQKCDLAVCCNLEHHSFGRRYRRGFEPPAPMEQEFLQARRKQDQAKLERATIRRADGHWVPMVGSKGRIRYMGAIKRLHRLHYEIKHGKPLGTSNIYRTCDLPECINPSHYSEWHNQDTAAHTLDT